MTLLQPHPDRLFPSDPTQRDIARRLYAEVARAPIYSPHGHVDARLLLDDQPFGDPAALLITPDHYVLRLLHAAGVPLDDLGLRRDGAEPTSGGRGVWRRWRSTGTSSWAHRCGSGSSPSCTTSSA